MARTRLTTCAEENVAIYSCLQTDAPEKRLGSSSFAVLDFDDNYPEDDLLGVAWAQPRLRLAMSFL